MQARLPRAADALRDGDDALGQSRVVVAVGDVHAQVAERADQPRAAVVAVLNGMAVSYLAHDAPQRVALEHRFAMWVAGLAEPSGTVVFPRLPAAVGVSAVSEPPRKVVLVVHGRAVETALSNHLVVRDALKRVAFTAFVRFEEFTQVAGTR